MTALSEEEKQIVASLSWFRSRYALFLGLDLERAATKEAIEQFGEVWIGSFKRNWGKAFNSLTEKEILHCHEGQYSFSEQGEEIRNEMESAVLFFKYEYDNFFTLEKNSAAHSCFCTQVYGVDLSQHGLVDQQELALLIDKLSQQGCQNILDIGCGNGRITEYVSKQIPAAFTGIDISTEAIDAAKRRTAGSQNLRFAAGNMNSLSASEKFDAIVLIDTIYYARSVGTLLHDCLAALHEGGTLYIYFSQWIMDASYAENLKGENTFLAKQLQVQNLPICYTDLTDSGIQHWKKKLSVLEKMKSDFFEEGNDKLWNYRYREALRYAHWGDDKYARYLYEVKK